MTGAGPVLRDIHVPPAAWWPPAPGWWALTGAVVLLIAVSAAWWILRRGRIGLARTLTREIAQLEAAYAADRDAAALAAGASRLLRRVALRVEPDVAALHGAAWRAFLQRRSPGGRSAASLDTLAATAFQRDPDIDAPALLAALREWCTHALRTPRAATTTAPQARKQR